MDVQPVVDPANVEPDRIYAHSQRFRAAFVAMTFGQKLQNPYLARRQFEIRLAGRRVLAESQDNSSRDLRGHRRASGVQFVDRIEEPLRLGLFEQVTTRAGADRGEDGVVISVHGEHEDRQVGELLMQKADTRDSRHARQADVGQEHIRPRAFERRKSFLHGSILTGDFKTGRPADERSQAFTSGSLVLNQGDSNLRHVK